ncbi:hypothetical protein L228DRAFT_284697 [Xylona heveae TC161]|uniref:Uncharacterized protein n=1 Tax=Xylona heveae (strain CBS 132557 / TC161) TaxID=1328760 RepID=A0A165FA39_XYLHT|nr:hypothetical protein L228DRAFT_284697 [Xylona heveae TC161]KZF20755.1 hypothetical protein L228DRAFT_284697 [Xylona heveae TC161]
MNPLFNSASAFSKPSEDAQQSVGADTLRSSRPRSSPRPNMQDLRPHSDSRSPGSGFTSISHRNLSEDSGHRSPSRYLGEQQHSASQNQIGEAVPSAEQQNNPQHGFLSLSYSNPGSQSGPEYQRGDRLRQFFRPDGRRVHVARSPEELEHLRRNLSTTSSRNGNDARRISSIAAEKNSESVEGEQEPELMVHGSPEHVEALRESHAHHEARRRALREKYRDVYEEIEQLQDDLGTISGELRMLSGRNHSEQLDENFSKFGYSANIRAHSGSSDNSTYGEASLKRVWEGDGSHGQAIKLWKRPVVRQYFHKGLLWRASDQEEVACFELFVDLLYVGIIAINGDTAVEDPNGLSLLRFCVTFILSWKIWSEITLIVSLFEIDDIFQRVCILLDMAFLFGFTTNIVGSWGQTYAPMIAFYLASRLFEALFYFQIAWLIPMVRGTMFSNILTILIPSALWIGSIHLSQPIRLVLIWIAIFLDLTGSVISIGIMRWTQSRLSPSPFVERLIRFFEFFPAINIEHRCERTNAFVTLIFGYSVVGLLYQNASPIGINSVFGKAILGLVQAFSFNWLYFEIDAFNIHVHAIRRHVFSSLVWMSLHLPFIMCFTLAGAALSRLVVAHDCPDVDPEKDLTAPYIERSEAEISPGLRWFYCAGLGIALGCMAIISMTHIHRSIPGQRLRKSYRLAVRFAVAIVLICLPLADLHSSPSSSESAKALAARESEASSPDTESRKARLNSLELVATTTGLVVLVLVVELLGSACVHESFWGCRKKCCYTATRRRIDGTDAESNALVGERGPGNPESEIFPIQGER